MQLNQYKHYKEYGENNKSCYIQAKCSLITNFH